MNKSDISDILKHNRIDVPEHGNLDKFLDRLVDCILFGKLEPCKECNGTLLPTTYEYTCIGFISGFTACNFATTLPIKSKLKFKLGPDYLLKKFPILNKIKLPTKNQNRSFPT